MSIYIYIQLWLQKYISTWSGEMFCQQKIATALLSRRKECNPMWQRQGQMSVREEAIHFERRRQYCRSKASIWKGFAVRSGGSEGRGSESLKVPFMSWKVGLKKHCGKSASRGCARVRVQHRCLKAEWTYYQVTIQTHSNLFKNRFGARLLNQHATSGRGAKARGGPGAGSEVPC